MEIIKDLRPKTHLYKFIHPNCCEFTATGDEFRWTTGQYNESVANVICPQCGEQFYITPQEIAVGGNELILSWPKISNCIRNCKKCYAKCLYRKEKNEDIVTPKD